jgi:Flp pilus assembly protein TadD
MLPDISEGLYMSDRDLEAFLNKNRLMTPEAILNYKVDPAAFYEISIKVLEPYVTDHPNDAGGHAMLGHTYFKKGSIDQAITQYELALNISPGDYSVRHDLGVALREKGYRDGGC